MLIHTFEVSLELTNELYYNRILGLFDLIDTNYVTATNDAVKLFKDRYIPTPMELYEDYRN